MLAALAYPIIIVAILALVLEPYRGEEFVGYHAKQAVALHLLVMVGWTALLFLYMFVMFIPIAGMVAAFCTWPAFFIVPAVFIYQVVLAVRAYGGRVLRGPAGKGAASEVPGAGRAAGGCSPALEVFWA